MALQPCQQVGLGLPRFLDDASEESHKHSTFRGRLQWQTIDRLRHL